MFSLEPERKRRAEEIVAGYPQKRAALLPLLWLVVEQERHVSPEALAFVAEMAGASEAEVREVASFYTLIPTKPVGKNHIQVCTGPCCMLRGAASLLSFLKERLGVDPGETTPDGLFTLSKAGCLGSCGTAPMMRVNERYYEDLDAKRAEEILNSLLGD